MEGYFHPRLRDKNPHLRRHHKARGLFHSDDWVKAMMEGNESAIDMMVRMALLVFI